MNGMRNSDFKPASDKKEENRSSADPKSFSPPDVSICMVSLNCRGVLKNCLDSLPASVSPFSYEVIVVDNASSDDTVVQIRGYHFPQLRLLQNDRNSGFTQATNQAIKLSSGRYILWLNTDTVLNPMALAHLCEYLDANPKVGIVGPMVLNLDGSFQPQCRRGWPTPWASFSHLLRLDRLWPRHAGFGQYLLSYLPIEQACQVDAVSGCCLLARREVLNEIGHLDEDYFGFGEDLDWCVRAKKKGWEVWYYPQSVIVHLKGQGGAHAKPYHKIWGIHQAMRVFYSKHLSTRYPWFLSVWVHMAIWGSFVLSVIGVWFGQIKRGCARARLIY